ncbi:MAG: tetratricopeptide repeat protein [Bacteroidia bacterium]
MKKICFSFYLLILLCFFAKAQRQKTDSLFSALTTAKEDTNKVILLNKLGIQLRNAGNSSRIEACLQEAEKLSIKLGYKKGEADAICETGLFHELQGNYFEALTCQFKALKLREEIGDKSGISYSIHYIGDIYFTQSELSDKASTKADYNKKALDQYFKSLQIAEEAGDSRSIANSYNCIGNSYREQKDFTQSLAYYLKAVKNREAAGDSMYLSQTYTNIGKMYLLQGEYQKALDYLFPAQRLAEKTDFKRTLVKIFGTIGNIYLKQKDYEKALDYCNRSLVLSREIGFLEYIAKANHSLSEIYSSPDFLGRNSDKALVYYKDFIRDRDSINTKKATQIELQFDFDKKEALAKAEQEKKDALTAKEKQKTRLAIYSVSIGLCLVLAFALFILRSYRQKQKANLALSEKNKLIAEQKKEVEEKQKEIMDSIRYARRIQSALITSEKYIHKNIERLKG